MRATGLWQTSQNPQDSVTRRQTKPIPILINPLTQLSLHWHFHLKSSPVHPLQSCTLGCMLPTLRCRSLQNSFLIEANYVKIKNLFQGYSPPLIFSTLEKCIFTHCFCICIFPRQLHTVESVPFPEATKPERHYLPGKEVTSVVIFRYFLKAFLIAKTFFSTV